MENRKANLKKILDGLNLRIDERIEQLNLDLNFAVNAKRTFDSAEDTKKREIISYLGSNLTLTNGVLDIELKNPLKRVAEMAKEIDDVAKRFEPLENIDNKAQFSLYLSQNPTMGG